MYIHKIEKDKHQEFLAQNRKDPITGDLIKDNDEVVFCASCKSVFLMDTWNYLNQSHCQQNHTLKEFPSSSVIHLKSEETILFYQALHSTNKRKASVPRRAKTSPWIHKTNQISSFQGLFSNPVVRSLKVISWIFGVLLFFIYHSSVVMFAFAFTFILQCLEIVHNWYYGGKVKSIYKNFKVDTFYITNKAICFSEPYGMNYYILPMEEIEELIFHESNGVFDSTYCKIYYKEKGIEQIMKFDLPSQAFQNTVSFLHSLKMITNYRQTPIRIESKTPSTLSLVHQIIAEGNSNFMLGN